jgi:cytochrome c
MRRTAMMIVCASLTMAAPTRAQFTPPEPPKINPAALFRTQCATCHTLNAADPPRQGPTLSGLIGRRAGVVPGYKYSPGFAKADFVWDEPHLDAYLTNPQSVIPGGVMPYRQAKPEVRAAIIAFLEEQH